MPVVLLVEWDNPKCDERNKERQKYQNEVWSPYGEKLIEEKGVKVKSSGWSDNTGHIVVWREYDSMEDFAKEWEDERNQQMWARWTHFADNIRYRLLRPSITVPEDLLK